MRQADGDPASCPRGPASCARARPFGARRRGCVRPPWPPSLVPLGRGHGGHLGDRERFGRRPSRRSLRLERPDLSIARHQLDEPRLARPGPADVFIGTSIQAYPRSLNGICPTASGQDHPRRGPAAAPASLAPSRRVRGAWRAPCPNHHVPWTAKPHRPRRARTGMGTSPPRPAQAASRSKAGASLVARTRKPDAARRSPARPGEELREPAGELRTRRHRGTRRREHRAPSRRAPAGTPSTSGGTRTRRGRRSARRSSAPPGRSTRRGPRAAAALSGRLASSKRDASARPHHAAELGEQIPRARPRCATRTRT